MPYELEPVADYACQTGEGPLWHPEHGLLYWTDIPRGLMFSYDPVSGEHRQVYEGRVVGGMTLQADGKLLLFMDNCSIATWDGEQVTFLIDEIAEDVGNRFNDVLADPEGRVFAGTMSTPEIPGKLYRIDPDLSIHKVFSPTKTSNGMGFSPDLGTFYFTDTGPGIIYAFDYDRASGELTHQRVHIQVDEPGGGRPDGMVMDNEGCIWSARWDGSCVVRYSPLGDEVDRIHFPTRKVTCPVFAGPDYRTMYITTAGGQDRASNGELAGVLFRTQPQVGGHAKFFSRLGL